MSAPNNNGYPARSNGFRSHFKAPVYSWQKKNRAPVVESSDSEPEEDPSPPSAAHPVAECDKVKKREPEPESSDREPESSDRDLSPPSVLLAKTPPPVFCAKTRMRFILYKAKARRHAAEEDDPELP